MAESHGAGLICEGHTKGRIDSTKGACACCRKPFQTGAFTLVSPDAQIPTCRLEIIATEQ
jgi:hypothetical protein